MHPLHGNQWILREISLLWVWMIPYSGHLTKMVTTGFCGKVRLVAAELVIPKGLYRVDISDDGICPPRPLHSRCKRLPLFP